LYGSYESGVESDPTGSVSGPYRVLRGGAWYYDTGICTVANRWISGPTTRDYTVGFRCVRR